MNSQHLTIHFMQIVFGKETTHCQIKIMLLESRLDTMTTE